MTRAEQAGLLYLPLFSIPERLSRVRARRTADTDAAERRLPGPSLGARPWNDSGSVVPDGDAAAARPAALS